MFAFYNDKCCGLFYSQSRAEYALGTDAYWQACCESDERAELVCFIMDGIIDGKYVRGEDLNIKKIIEMNDAAYCYTDLTLPVGVKNIWILNTKGNDITVKAERIIDDDGCLIEKDIASRLFHRRII